jgi:hypothetical protein
MATRKAVIDERVQVAIGLDEDVPASSAVAAVGSAERDELLAAEADAAAATVSGNNVDVSLVNEFHDGS